MIFNFIFSCFLSILVLFVAVTVANESIIGGKKSEHGQFLYHVLIEFHSEHRKCGGGIIADEFILTAGHCVFKQNKTIDDGRITVLAGSHDVFKTNSPAVKVDVKKIFVLKNFVPATIPPDDIAVLKLKHPLGLENNQNLGCLQLPKWENENYVGEAAIITGFGWSWIEKVAGKEIGGYLDGKLRFAVANILEPVPKVPNADKRFHDRKVIWARMKQEKNVQRGACVGDSGGPLVHDGQTVIGILSGGPSDCSEKNKASAYTDVSQYLQFVKNALMEKHSDDIRVQELK